MKYLFTSLILFLLLPGVWAQDNVREKLYVHLNSDEFIVGETVNFSIYCMSEKTSKLSPLSKIVYLEIIGEKGPVYQEKIQLKNGRGHGSFFIPSLLTTGRYQVVAFTRWMKNFEDYYRVPIAVINPYEPYELKDSVNTPLFIPSNKSILAGITNFIAYRIPEGYSGRVVSSEGENLAEVNPDRFGIGSFNLKARASENYQVILEDTLGNFEFYQLPAPVESGVALTLFKTDLYLTITLHALPSSEAPYQLRILKGRTTVSDTDLISGESVRLNRNELRGQPLLIQAFNQTTEVANRLYFEPSAVSNEVDSVGQYTTRQVVSVKQELPPGSYSISVKRNTALFGEKWSYRPFTSLNQVLINAPVDLKEYAGLTDPDLDAFILLSQINKSALLPAEGNGLLPEFQEQILSGTLRITNQDNAGHLIALAFSGEIPQTRITKTREGGRFQLPFESPLLDASAYLKPLALDSGFQLVLDKPFRTDYPDFNYQLPELDSIQIAGIVERSIQNQLYNAFSQITLSGSPENTWSPQVPFDEVYTLDDYVRFPTVKETFVEIIPTVSVRESRNPQIKALTSPKLQGADHLPLLLLDGIPVSSETLLDFSPYKIERIEVLNNQYYLGTLIADGVISFRTKPDNLEKFPFDDSYNQVAVKGLQLSETIDNQVMEPVPTNQPDQRYQLYWNPEWKVNEPQISTISFTTSDITGNFRVEIEGFSDTGEAVYKSMEFQVVDTPTP